MNYKIIVTSQELPDVLLHRDKDEETEVVHMKAIGFIDGEPDMYAVETVYFDSAKSAIGFVRDYSVESANEWCAEFGITNEKPKPNTITDAGTIKIPSIKKDKK